MRRRSDSVFEARAINISWGNEGGVAKRAGAVKTDLKGSTEHNGATKQRVRPPPLAQPNQTVGPMVSRGADVAQLHTVG
jgi:hypothetical protein